MPDSANQPMRLALREQVALVLDTCVKCPKCMAECAFLKKYGTPKAFADACNPSDKNWLLLAYECSLCGLCASVCPVDLNPAAMFLEMRREAVDRGFAPFPEHKVMMDYEQRGASKRYSYYSLPRGCHTVLFPGCTLPGTRPDSTISLYRHLKTADPNLGIVLDCCCKPSHDLGRQAFFETMFNEMKSYLIDHDIKTIIAACPNCFQVFKEYGKPLEVIMTCESLLKQDLPKASQPIGTRIISIHDPCVLRNETSIHQAIRKLAKARGFVISEMIHSREHSMCCGEGGSVGFVTKNFSEQWGENCRKEVTGRRLLTYCAGCANKLNKKVPTDHILDTIFNPSAVPTATYRVSKAPWTYLNRLKLKRYLKKNHPAAVKREREFFVNTPSSKKRSRQDFLFPVRFLFNLYCLCRQLFKTFTQKKKP